MIDRRIPLLAALAFFVAVGIFFAGDRTGSVSASFDAASSGKQPMRHPAPVDTVVDAPVAPTEHRALSSGQAAVQPALSNAQLIDDFALRTRKEPYPLAGGLTTKAMHEAMLAETRDDAWAGDTEKSVRDFVATLRERFGNAPSIPSVECRQTLCEIHAVSSASAMETAAGWQNAMTSMRDSKEWSKGFVDSHTVSHITNDGRVVSVTYLVR